MKTAERHRRAKEVLEIVGLGKRMDHYPNQLSGGQQQRVAIARALINEPSILLADEPTGNLDTRTSIEVMDIFQKLNLERGITVVLITHEMDIAEHGTRFVKFRDGRIQIDQQITKRRMASEELKHLPPPDDDTSHVPPSALPPQASSSPQWATEELMSILMTLRIALKALNRNKMRTILTMLGMIIGVGAVITMVALGTGARTTIEERVKSAGTNMIMVNAGNFSTGGVRMGQGNSTTMTPEDATAHQGAARRPVRRRPARRRRGQIIAGNQNWSTQVQGTDIDLPLIRSWPTKYGSFFTQPDVTGAQKVAVLGTRRLRHAVRARRGSDRADHPHPQPAVQGDRRDGEQGAVVDGPGSGRHDLRPLHDGDEEAAGAAEHQQHHGVGRQRATRSRTSAEVDPRGRCGRATRSCPATRTTSWSARSRKWPASRPRPPRR